MSERKATKEQIERYIDLVVGNGLEGYELNVNRLKNESWLQMEIDIEGIQEEVRDKEAMASAYFNEF